MSCEALGRDVKGPSLHSNHFAWVWKMKRIRQQRQLSRGYCKPKTIVTEKRVAVEVERKGRFEDLVMDKDLGRGIGNVKDDA